MNEEEGLLEFDETAFPLLTQMFQTKQPFDSLWNTALRWHTSNELWLNGKRRKNV